MKFLPLSHWHLTYIRIIIPDLSGWLTLLYAAYTLHFLLWILWNENYRILKGFVIFCLWIQCNSTYYYVFCDLSVQTEMAHKNDIQHYTKFYNNLGIEIYYYSVYMYRVFVTFFTVCSKISLVSFPEVRTQETVRRLPPMICEICVPNLFAPS